MSAPPATTAPPAPPAPVAQPALPPLFRLTGADDFPLYLKALLTGPPKSGKTSFLGTVPNIVIADTEPHANNLQSIAHKNLPYVTVNSTNDLQRLRFVLGDASLRAKAAEQMGMPKIEAVSIDTVDTLQQLMKSERMHEQNTTKFQRDDWSWLKDELTAIIRSFTALPMHVFFTVHIKSKEIGGEDDKSNVFWPMLQGSMDEEIAGMVGYSLVTFRREDVRPDGSKYTRYLLRAEGNETYQFVGNRAAGRLPDVIEPNFQAVYDAAMAGRAQISTPVQPGPVTEVQANGVAQAPPVPPSAAAPPVAPPASTAPTAPAAPPQEVAQNPGQSAPAPAAPPVAPPAAATPQPGQQQKEPDDAPVNAAAFTFAKRVYDECGLEFPEALIRGLTLGDVRMMVKMWQAIQQDSLESTVEEAPPVTMGNYLRELGWLSDADRAKIAGGETPTPAPAPAGPTPDPGGTIEQVMAWVGEDLGRAQQAYDAEMAKSKPRSSLINTLTTKGAKTHEQPAQGAPDPNQTPVQTPPAPVAEAAPVAAAEPITSAAPPADATSDDQQTQAAMATLQNTLGAVPIGEDGKPLPCDGCGGQVDDEDIATLSGGRYGKRLCISCYIAENQKH